MTGRQGFSFFSELLVKGITQPFFIFIKLFPYYAYSIQFTYNILLKGFLSNAIFVCYVLTS